MWSRRSPGSRSLRFLSVVGVTMFLAACANRGQLPEETYSAAELEEIKQEWAEYFQIEDPPDVQLVREVGSWELKPVIDDCMERHGFMVNEFGRDDAYGNEDNFRLAQYTCHMQYLPPKKYVKKWGEEQIRIQYVWTRDFVIPCLEYEGHPISGLPSESAFIESYLTDPFYPFSQVNLKVPSKDFNSAWNALEQKCTQIAPGPVLWEGMSVDEWKRLHPYETEGASTPPQ